MLKPVQTVAPVGTIVSVEEAKANLRIDHDAEDGVIYDLIAAVDAYLDGWSGVLGRCVRPQTWIYRTATLEDTRLPFPDVQSAVVRYLDAAGVEQTLPAQNYRLHNDDQGGLLELVDGVAQPSVLDRIDAVRIEAVYGMAVVPPALKRAALLMVGFLYQNREGSGEKPYAVDMLIAPFRAQGV
jgi:uncharacterized phiE125 gp8 family phage protein